MCFIIMDYNNINELNILLHDFVYTDKLRHTYEYENTPAKNITMNDIKEHPNYPWVPKWILRNPNLTMEFIEERPDSTIYPWDWYAISRGMYGNRYNELIKERIFYLTNE